MTSRRTIAALVVLLALLTAGLLMARPRRVAGMDGIYFAWDQRRILCALNIDDSTYLVPDLDNLREGMERARARGEVMLPYGHEPGGRLSVERLESVLALANELELPFFTYGELLGPPRGAGIAISFDDSRIDAWHEHRAIFTAHGARVTFFVTRFDELSRARIDMLHALRADGHAIECHGLNHIKATDYVETHGLPAWIEDEVRTSLELMRREGFTPTIFAYPFGARTAEIDRAALDHVTLLRSVDWPIRGPINFDPCPN